MFLLLGQVPQFVPWNSYVWSFQTQVFTKKQNTVVSKWTHNYNSFTGDVSIVTALKFPCLSSRRPSHSLLSEAIRRHRYDGVDVRKCLPGCATNFRNRETGGLRKRCHKNAKFWWSFCRSHSEFGASIPSLSGKTIYSFAGWKSFLRVVLLKQSMIGYDWLFSSCMSKKRLEYSRKL